MSWFSLGFWKIFSFVFLNFALDSIYAFVYG